jgi:hypothetical protein
LLVCPTGEITAIWYQNAKEGQPNIDRGDIEFGFILIGFLNIAGTGIAVV